VETSRIRREREGQERREVRTQTPESEFAGPRRELPEGPNAKERNQIPRPDFVVHSDPVGVPEEYTIHRGDDSPGRPTPRRGCQTNKILLWEVGRFSGPYLFLKKKKQKNVSLGTVYFHETEAPNWAHGNTFHSIGISILTCYEYD
jgi:hypothetical protein